MASRNKFITMTPEIYEYTVAHGHNGDPLLRELAEETAKLGPIAMMQISPEQGTFMGILARAIGAKSAVEIGTFTGYSAICVARALPHDGRMLCCDVSDEWTKIARRYWERAGVANKITLKLGPGAETLRALPASHTFDIGFIDADKPNYKIYYEEILKHLRPRGLILLDNVLWGGAVADASDQSENTRAIRELNDFISRDSRVEAVLMPVADGIMVVQKK